MKKLKLIHLKATLTTMPTTGALGLSGEYLIIDEIVFDNTPCYVIKDWDGEGESCYIVAVQAIENENDVEVWDELYRSSLDEWLTHPNLIPESRK